MPLETSKLSKNARVRSPSLKKVDGAGNGFPGIGRVSINCAAGGIAIGFDVDGTGFQTTQGLYATVESPVPHFKLRMTG